MAHVASDDPTPERLVFSGEVRRKVGVAMARMSAVEKSAFALRHFEGLSIDEIGRALDLDQSATKTRSSARCARCATCWAAIRP